ncbi:hypothetical protein [Labedella populi]|nr:hypothetical protein [Labedella populi]
MALFLILLALILVTGVVWTLVVTARDGYRRIPNRGSTRVDRIVDD